MAATTKVWVNDSAPQCEDDDLNGFKNENNNLIVAANLSLNTGDNDQTSQAVSIHTAGADYYTSSGTNTYSLTTLVTPGFIGVSAYFTGMRIRTSFSNANTSTTVTVAVNGLLAVSVKKNGSDPAIGDVDGFAEMVYNGTDFDLVVSEKDIAQVEANTAKLATINPAGIMLAGGEILSDGSGSQSLSRTFGFSGCTINVNAFRFTLSNAITEDDMYFGGMSLSSLNGTTLVYNKISSTIFDVTVVNTNTDAPFTFAGTFFSVQVYDAGAV